MSQDKAHSPPQFEPEQSLRENERRLAADMERKTVEAKLKAQSERFQRIIENTDAGYFRMGTDGCYEDVNPAWLRMYGFSSREDIVGQHFSLVQHTEDLAKAEEIVEALIRGEPVRSGEFSRLRRDRTVGYHTFSAVPVLDDDRVIGIEGFLIDISRRKHTEDALQKSEEKFARAFQSNPAALVITDLTTACYLDVNQTFEELSGYRRDEVIGRRWEELGLWADTSERDEAVRRLRTNGSVDNLEFTFRKKNGDVGKGLISADLIEIDGNPCAITATIDITEHRQLEDQLAQALRLDSIGRLASGVAHDFNNFLMVIAADSDFLLESIGPNDPLRPHVDGITKATEHAASLTKNLLAFGRKQVIKPKQLDLNKIISDSVWMMQRLVGKDIGIATRLDPLLGQVVADPEQVHQILMNLVLNARDAMPEGGRLDIETTNVQFDEDRLTMHPGAKPGHYVMMAIKDEGTGMNEQTRQHIFEPFFTTKKRGKGTGLGLSTVYGIVRQSGGWIAVSSQVGVGTSFNVYLPCKEWIAVAETSK